MSDRLTCELHYVVPKALLDEALATPDPVDARGAMTLPSVLQWCRAMARYHAESDPYGGQSVKAYHMGAKDALEQVATHLEASLRAMLTPPDR
jgi:hypothetical protein